MHSHDSFDACVHDEVKVRCHEAKGTDGAISLTLVSQVHNLIGRQRDERRDDEGATF